MSSAGASDVALRAAVDRESRRARVLATRDVLLSVLTPVALLAVWEVGAHVGFVDGRLFSPPSAIIERAGQLVADGTLLKDTWATVVRLVSGFVLGTVAGIVVGLLMGVWRPLRAALDPTLTALYALPKIAILPLLLLIFGLTETPKVLSVAISVFFVIQINTMAGIVQIDPRIREAALAYRATGVKLFRWVLLPGAMPSILTGMRVAAGMAVIVITAVEFVASNDGLGFVIWNSWQLFDPATMYVGLIAVSLLGALMTLLIILLERVVLPWKHTSSSKENR